MPTDDLDRVRVAAQAERAARIELSRSVLAAREAGHSWAEVGRLLGMSRQAVFKRFAQSEDTVQDAGPRPVEQAVAAARSVYEQLDAGQIDALRSRMPPGVAEVLTETVLSTTWARAVEVSGALSRQELTVVEDWSARPVDAAGRVQGPLVVELQLVGERSTWRGRVALDEADRVVGVLVVPPGDGPTPF